MKKELNTTPDLNRKLNVGLFILGALSHYDKDEVIKYPSIQYIAKTLTRKHFSIRNGSANERIWKNEGYARDEAVKFIRKGNDKKAEECQEKHKVATINHFNRQNSWIQHATVSNKAWLKASDNFPATNAITVSGLILAILRKEEAVAKWYGFNQKKLIKFQESSEHKEKYIFSSSRVATELLSCLDNEIAYYNFNRDKK